MYYLLSYQYVPDILTKREPFRAQHLSILQDYQDRDQLLVAGATGDPVTGAAIVFKVDSVAKVQQFIDVDPYVANNLVTGYTIEPWSIVIGSALENEKQSSNWISNNWSGHE